MRDDQSYIEEMTRRYIWAVVKHLPAKGRSDIETELKGLIEDMLAERTGGGRPTPKDLDVVLAELGAPYELAQKYIAQDRYLIGPELFPKYWLVLRIVLAAEVFGLTLAAALTAALGGAAGIGAFVRWLANLCVGAAVAFGFVTLFFAVAERQGGRLRQQLMHQDWKLSELPPVPPGKSRIPRGEPIAGIIFTVLVMILFGWFSELMGAWLPHNGWRIVPIFDAAVLNARLPLLFLCFTLGLAREIAKLLEGRYTMRLMWVTLGTNIASLLLCIAIFADGSIFNRHLVQDLAAAGVQLSEGAWAVEHFGTFLLALLIFAFVLDIATDLWRTLRYRDTVQ